MIRESVVCRDCRQSRGVFLRPGEICDECGRSCIEVVGYQPTDPDAGTKIEIEEIV